MSAANRGQAMTDPEHYACYGGACYNRRCPKCGRWTKAPKSVTHRETAEGTVYGKCGADCKKCGKVELEFEGWFGEDELT